MPSIDDIAAEYVERAAALDPDHATYSGIAGHDHELPDLSADGFAGRAGLDRSTLAALDAAEAPDPREQAARAAMRERLALAVERYDAGDTTSELNTINSWVQMVREVFDLMPTEGEEAAADIAKPMAAVPGLPPVVGDLARRGQEWPLRGQAAGRGDRRAARGLGQAGGFLLFRTGQAADRSPGVAARGAGRGRARATAATAELRLPRPRADAAGQGEGCLRA